MSVPEIASLMPFYTLTKGQQVRFTALDASSGVDVSGVVISEMVIGVSAEPTASPPIALGFSRAFSQGDQAA
jgi:hypothetical protein